MYCVLSVAADDDTNASPNSIIFVSLPVYYQRNKIICSCFTLSAKYNKKLSKVFSKDLKY